MSSTVPFVPTPALLTSTSTGPNWSAISAKPFSTEASSATSSSTRGMSTPWSAAIACNFAARATSRTVPTT